MNSFPNDPVIDEIRAVRHQISEHCNHNPAQLVAYYMKLQEQHRDRMIGSQGSLDRPARSAVKVD